MSNNQNDCLEEVGEGKELLAKLADNDLKDEFARALVSKIIQNSAPRESLFSMALLDAFHEWKHSTQSTNGSSDEEEEDVPAMLRATVGS